MEGVDRAKAVEMAAREVVDTVTLAPPLVPEEENPAPEEEVVTEVRDERALAVDTKEVSSSTTGLEEAGVEEVVPVVEASVPRQVKAAYPEEMSEADTAEVAEEVEVVPLAATIDPEEPAAARDDTRALPPAPTCMSTV